MYEFDWSVIWRNLDLFVAGAIVTIKIAVVTLIGGTIIGSVAAYARLSTVRPIKAAAGFYVGIIRGIPLLLIIYFAFFGLPTFGPLLNPEESVMLAMTVYAGAYITEIIRAGIEAVGRGQVEASKALGLTGFQAARAIVLPQAFRIALPAMGNQFISLIKDTSLAAAVSVAELTSVAIYINLHTFRVFEAYLGVGAAYLLMTTTIAYGLRLVERRSAAARSGRVEDKRGRPRSAAGPAT